MVAVVIVFIILWAVLGRLASWVAVQKGRPASEGMVLGLLFGFLGVLIELLLPARM